MRSVTVDLAAPDPAVLESAIVGALITEGQIEIIKAFETAEEWILTVEGSGEYLGEVSLLDPGRLIPPH